MFSLEYLFFFLLFLLIYTYLLYPWLATKLAQRVSDNPIIFQRDELPKVAILMSAFNEEKILEKKLSSVYHTKYPKELIYFYVGSDNSTDSTNSILEEFGKQQDNFFYSIYQERRGKANVINSLMNSVEDDIEFVILTDANVIFTEDCIYEMIKDFKNSKVGQVGANVINYDVSTDDIGAEEEYYIGRENRLKNAEGKLWGASMGAFGACYAIRKKLIPQIPANFLMEDFFISLHVLKNNSQALLNLKARVLEDIPGTLSQEFKRKKRISAGNFQNLSHYLWSFIQRFWPQGFVFFSHKILRWVGPFILIGLGLTLLALALKGGIFRILFYISIVVFALIVLDYIFQSKKIYFRPIRALRYFLMMNVALLMGFFVFLKGVKTNAWQPTIRK